MSNFITDDEIVEMYKAGVAWREFSAVYGVSSKRLKRALVDAGETAGRKTKCTKIDRSLDILEQLKATGNILYAANECIEFHHNIDVYGYPNVQINYRIYKVSRLILEQKVGIIDGKLACHSCDNPKCVNPDHLYAGTVKQNVDDMLKRNRFPVGSKSGQSKLTEAQVLEIRGKHSKGVSQKDLRKEYGIGNNAMSCLIRRKTWAHI